jgi:hypothetical protein
MTALKLSNARELQSRGFQLECKTPGRKHVYSAWANQRAEFPIIFLPCRIYIPADTLYYITYNIQESIANIIFFGGAVIVNNNKVTARLENTSP